MLLTSTNLATVEWVKEVDDGTHTLQLGNGTALLQLGNGTFLQMFRGPA